MPTASSPNIRLLNDADVDDALQLSLQAGWNQTAEDWRMLLHLCPGSCFCVEINGRVVSTATLIEYGKKLGWVGMVLTHPDYRKKGFAKLLLARVLKYADDSGVRTLKLDATDQGQPLYESLGFVSEQSVERWERPAIRGDHPPKEFASGAATWSEMDATAFGTDRSELLRALAVRGNVYSEQDLFVCTRTGRRTAYLGPCIAKRLDDARELVGVALATQPEQSWSWDLLPDNPSAVALATEFQFAPQRRLVRMSRGEPLHGNDQWVYAIAGFEFG